MKYVSVFLLVAFSVFPSILSLFPSQSVSVSLSLLSASSTASGTKLGLDKYLLNGCESLCVVAFLCFLSCAFVRPHSLSPLHFCSLCLWPPGSACPRWNHPFSNQSWAAL